MNGPSRFSSRFFFTLRPGSKKEPCPACNQRTFVPYVTTETGEILEGFGVCDRLNKCNYANHPNGETVKEFQRSMGRLDYQRIPEPRPRFHLEPIFVPAAVHAEYQRYAWDSHFIQFLNCCLPFPHTTEQLQNLCNDYALGGIPSDAGKYGGAIVFPFIDELGRIRSMQAAVYDPRTNKRQAFNWIHKMELEREEPASWAVDFKRYQDQGGSVISCLFGAHLIRPETETVLVYEAPKTALYMALRYPAPGAVHVATAGQTNLNTDRLRCAKGKRIILCPDLSENSSAFIDWAKKAERVRTELETVVVVDETLENMGTAEQRKAGWDWADFVSDFDWAEYAQAHQPKEEPDPWKELPTWNELPAWKPLPAWKDPC